MPGIALTAVPRHYLGEARLRPYGLYNHYMHHRGWVSIIVTLALLALTACGGGSSSTSTTPSGQDTTLSPGRSAPSLAELQARLATEFERLGIDPAKVTAQAPQKDENAVFDLAAELVDPDGEGGDPPTGITLTWTERLIADYNQDGMVTQNDLTPIGQNYCFDSTTAQVTYEDAETHGGIGYWPTGDPDDGADGSMNWRLGVIDGNNDGRILMHDITPIAVHYEERLTGYRIWRKAPGGSFVQLSNPDDAGSDLTLARPDTISASAPVRYSYTDNEATSSGLGEGSYAYYVQPWDGTSSTGGPVSAVVVLDNTGTVVPEQPVAQLTITPDFGSAPAEVTLDASGSTDSDGTVEVWHWDFDADGITDWVSTDAVPEESSTGIVDTITPVGDGVVTVTYRKGSAQWFFPGVAVEDNDGLISQPVYEQLGVTGWELEEIFSWENPLPIQEFLNIDGLTVDPVTGEPVVYGDAHFADDHFGFAFCRRKGPNDWEIEQIPAYDDAAYRDFCPNGKLGSLSEIYIVWDSDGAPLAFINYSIGTMYQVQQPFIATRNNGVWTSTRLTNEGEFSDGYIIKPVQINDGKWVTLLKIQKDEGNQYSFIEWDHGSVRRYDPEYPDYIDDEFLLGNYWLFSDPNGTIKTYFSRYSTSEGFIREPVVRFWAGTPETGWDWEIYDYTDLWPYEEDQCYIHGLHLNNDGSPVVAAIRSDNSTYDAIGVYIVGNICGNRRVDSVETEGRWYIEPDRYSFTNQGDCLWSSHSYYYLDWEENHIEGIGSRVMACMTDATGSHSELVIETPITEDSSGAASHDIVSLDDRRVYLLIRSNNWILSPELEYIETQYSAYYLGIRMDPRQ